MFIVSESAKGHKDPVSLLKSSDIFIALADLLLKGKKPFGLPQRRLGQLDPYYSSFQQFITDGQVGAILTTHDRLTHETLTQTVLRPGNEPCGTKLFHDPTFPRYKNPKYESALELTASKIKTFSGGKVENAFILVACAAQQPKHIFWPQKDWFGKDVYD